jgi:DNA polymerase
VVCLGATAAQALLGSRFPLLRNHGVIFSSPLASQVIATLHPSAVLRARDSETRKAQEQMLVDDLRKVRRLLEQPAEAARHA